jgi:hypothetical protein
MPVAELRLTARLLKRRSGRRDERIGQSRGTVTPTGSLPPPTARTTFDDA